MYLLEYRNLGIFQENIVNRILRDVVKAADPIGATVIGDFARARRTEHVSHGILGEAASGLKGTPKKR